MCLFVLLVQWAKAQRANGPSTKAPLKPTGSAPMVQRPKVAKAIRSIVRNRLTTLKITEDWIVDQGIANHSAFRTAMGEASL